MRCLLIAMISFLTCQGLRAQTFDAQKLRAGDFLFQDLDCGGLCDAIESVTPGLGSQHFSHVGLVIADGDSLVVIEAIGKAVHSTPIDKFLDRQLDSLGKPKVVAGRLKKPFQQMNLKAIAFARKQLGVKYDDYFLMDNQAYYCSELIYDAYKYANGGKPFFHLSPMTYKAPGSNEYMPAWTEYFKELNSTIPEGLPGCNPGSLATDPRMELVR
jgi:hypothetical protein